MLVADRSFFFLTAINVDEPSACIDISIGICVHDSYSGTPAAAHPMLTIRSVFQP